MNYVNTEVTNKPLKVPMEIWCRTCGYFRPISGQNKGKAEEFRERLNLKIPENLK